MLFRSRDPIESSEMSSAEAARHVSRIVRDMLRSPHTEWNDDGTHQISDDLSAQLHEYMTIAHPNSSSQSFTDVQRIPTHAVTERNNSWGYTMTLPSRPHGPNGELGFPVDENNPDGPRTHVAIHMNVSDENGTARGRLYDASRDPSNFIYTSRAKTGIEVGRAHV